MLSLAFFNDPDGNPLYLAEMKKQDRYQNRIELLQGTLDMLVLQALRWGAQHGYGISQAIRRGSEDVLQVETGSLYPALHRLENRRWLVAEWKPSETGRESKFYRLTRKGRAQLAAETAAWRQFSTGVSRILLAQ